MSGGRLPVAGSSDATPWPWPWPTPADAPGLVACPIPGAMPGVFAGAVQVLYRLAYERALADARPSRYTLAGTASPN